MNIGTMTHEEIRRKSLKVLTERLEIVSAVRFLQLFERKEETNTRNREKF